MSTPVLITPEMIATAERAGACWSAVRWLREAPRTIEDLVRDEIGFAAWALRYPGFIKLLTAEQFAKIVESDPFFALRDALDHLSDEQFAFCVDAEPLCARTYARHRLSPKQLKYCETNK